jgi:hypothetical protein
MFLLNRITSVIPDNAIFSDLPDWIRGITRSTQNILSKIKMDGAWNGQFTSICWTGRELWVCPFRHPPSHPYTHTHSHTSQHLALLDRVITLRLPFVGFLRTQVWRVKHSKQDQDGTAIPSWSCSTAIYKPVWHTALLSVQWINSWRWTDELSETCRVSCQNKFVKLVHLVGFIIKKFVTMHGHTNVEFLMSGLFKVYSLCSAQ